MAAVVSVTTAVGATACRFFKVQLFSTTVIGSIQTDAMSLLKSLVVVSEKAANIARICRQNEHLFGLLIEEKKEDEANPRFVKDFKTLADVLIQETVAHDLEIEFPELEGRIRGEESNVFCNALGDSVCVKVSDSKDDTRKLLSTVLNGDLNAADLLADEVHRVVNLEDVKAGDFPDDLQFDLGNCSMAVWIDPIDSTAEYISGKEVLGINDVPTSGLKCVTVLIGVYDITTGCPLIGIVNQPFCDLVQEKWQGRCYWGVSNVPAEITPNPTNVVCLSSSEDAEIKRKLKEAGFTIVEAAGAGYKTLLVINGAADAYLLSKDSTFKWDTCGPQAVLQGLGGDIAVFNKSSPGNVVSVSYLDGAEEGKSKIDGCCNRGGILAYRDEKVFDRIMEVLQ